jgi:Predicted nucleotide-binding protein containing TIR-like domain
VPSPRIFVGSSTESVDVARAVKAELERLTGGTVTVWEHAFEAGRTLAETFRDNVARHEFAVFVFAPDDRIVSRSQAQGVPRDNVVYELGLFTGALGPRRTFVIRPSDDSVKMPTDLAGVIYETYSFPDEDGFEALQSAVMTACAKIASAIKKEMPLSVGAEAPGVTASTPDRAAEALVAQLVADAQRQRLAPASPESLKPGTLVIHALHGVGRVRGHEPLPSDDAFVYVVFDAGVALLPVTELYTPPDGSLLTHTD